ncbi:class I SAM-dependent methyltransferase [Alicyclobacillus tolerans]|uniref:methyltransferase domain-containing protein n=1 Tax=Alicyclobacillus tolerans TaxID=90970 RepID=UPI001F3CAB31|nr:methyltransferase domain-containing protein [Alicyclobacillus tolerans]MCF8568464.1 class I SAM-dependent methyltransferase [Alicyclobacillus tolerans]
MRIPNFKMDDGAILYKDTVGAIIAPKVAQRVIEELDARMTERVKSVLDIACGPGTVSLAIAKKNPAVQVTGIDSSEAMLRQAALAAQRDKVDNVNFIQMDANAIAFEEKFDLAVCNLAFPFFSKPAQSMAGIKKSLSDGGEAVLSVPGAQTWQEFFEVVESEFKTAARMAKPFRAKINQAEKLPQAMQAAGFQHVEVSHDKIPFRFEAGVQVLDFFQNLFALLSYAPPAIQDHLANAIDKRYPQGFTMHYDAVIVRGGQDS